MRPVQLLSVVNVAGPVQLLSVVKVAGRELTFTYSHVRDRYCTAVQVSLMTDTVDTVL